MSPIRKPPPFSGRTLVIAVIAIICGVALLWVASAALTARHNQRPGGVAEGGIVDLGKASRLAAQFQRGGNIPIYFADVSGTGKRSIYLTHKGGSSTKGWTAFRAQVPDAPADCQWEWNKSTARFDASCDEARHVDANGTGLETYPATVTKDRLRVDLRDRPRAPSPS